VSWYNFHPGCGRRVGSQGDGRLTAVIRETYLELHLDLVGGLAGDMFIAAVLDAFPQYEPRVIDAIGALSESCAVACSLHEHHDHVLRGRRFQVRQLARDGTRIPFAAGHTSHTHTTWSTVRARLLSSALAPATRDHAIGIFQLLANAEAHVHGVEPDGVEFHEVGAWDSIADIVGAAALIDAVGASRWTASAAPLGSGRVATAHGLMAVPAPATTRLLIGMPTIDDGVAGERVTPTGAAILRYLCPPPKSGPPRGTDARTLIATGIGFGARVLAGLSNHVRVLCFEPTAAAMREQRIEVLEFEVDDQSGEDLALGLERLRARRGVLDATQCAVLGKKGRMCVHVQVLVRQAQLADVIDACFRETTTLGLRHQTVRRIALKRKFATSRIDHQSVGVKLAERPGGMTAKGESDDVAAQETHARRASVRARAELDALKGAAVALKSEAVIDA
jgi:uncharacterized protein (TIGR00299 family) protein